MDEAEQLADRVGIMDHGRLVAEGSRAALVDDLGADTIRVLGKGAAGVLEQLFSTSTFVQSFSRVDGGFLLGVESSSRHLAEVVTIATEAGFVIEDVSVAKPDLGAGNSYIGFMLPGIVALSAMGGGMAWLDERVRGIIKEYLVAPIPRLSILLGNVGSTVSKALVQALVIFVVGIVMGADVSTDPIGWLLGLALLVGYAMGFTGLALAVASKTDDLMAYHAMIMLLNLPVLFLSNALYPMASLPDWMKVGAMANPTSYFVDGIRQTMLVGTGELPLCLCLVVTTGFAALGLTAASRAFAAKTKRS